MLLLLLAPPARAATIPAASCSQADVQAAIDSSAAGDIVAIPAGTCTWTSGISIHKGIALQGAGSGRIIAYTSDTLTVGTGSRTLNIQSGLNLAPGQVLRISQTGTRGNFMDGTVTSYSGTTLVMNITATGGSGTTHRWLVSTPPTTVLINNVAGSGAVMDVTEDTARHIEISNIKFAAGAGTAYGIQIHYAANGQASFLHDCWMESTDTSSSLYRSDSNRGVIWNSSFDSSPFSMAPEAIQHKDDQSVTGNSWTTPSAMGMNDTTGQSNLYVEDCDFHAWLNLSDNDSNARTVYRHNLFNNAGMGSHGADSSTVGSRYFEVYDNRMVFNGYTDGTTFNMNWWLFLRGGTFLLTGNTMDKIISQDYGNKNDVNMTVMNLQRNIGPNPCWGAGSSGGADYHAPRQVGMGYVTGTGKDGLGRTNDVYAYVGDSEPAYIWGNTVNNGPLNVGTADYGSGSSDSCTGSTYDTSANYIVAGRDYFNNGTAKPGWTRYPYPQPLRTLALSPSLSQAPLPGVPWSGILDPSRAIDWTTAGVPGGIPTNRIKCVTTACAALENAAASYRNGTTEAAGLIQSALDSAPVNTVVHLPAGTYLVSSMVVVPSNTTLRGDGPDKTVITAASGGYAILAMRSGGYGSWGDFFDPGGLGRMVSVPVTGGANKDATIVSIASNPGIHAGDMLYISQVDDGALVNPLTDQVDSQGIQNTWTCVTDLQGGSRCLGQLLEATNATATSVSFKPALNWTYSSSLSPLIRIAPAGDYVSWAGIEDLKIMESATIQDVTMIDMEGARYSWLKNVETQNATYRSLWMTGGFHNEVRDSYFHDPNINNPMECGRNRAYGIALDGVTSNSLIINNIVKNLDGDSIFTFGGASGNVMAYNYMTSPCFYDSTYLSGSPGMNHGAHPMMNLWEGNAGVGLASDILQGSSSHNTVFRAYSPGWTNTENGNQTPVNGAQAVMIEARNRYVNVVGSVLGKPGWTDSYQNAKGQPSSGNHPIWLLGYAGGSGFNMDDAPTVLETLFRAGNFDYRNNCAWDDAHGRCLSSGELSALNIPASLFLSAKPSFFATAYGSVPWPPIGSEVSGGQDTAGHANKLPAQLCYEHTAAVNMPFNAASCYGALSSPKPVLSVDRASLSFNAVAGGANPASQTVSVSNGANNGTTLAWTGSDNQPWLSLAPVSGGNGPTTVTVSVNTAGLAAGAYGGILTFTDANASPAQQTVSVTLTLNPGPTVPALSNGSPTGTLAAGTVLATLSLNTDVSASCKYAAQANVAYSAMTNTFAANGAGTTHTATVNGLTNGRTYNDYVRCANSQDATKVNTTDFLITFAVNTPGNPPPNSPPPDPVLNLPTVLPINGDIRLDNASSYNNVTFTWTFTPSVVTPAEAGAQLNGLGSGFRRNDGAAFGAPAGTGATSPAPQLSLGSVANLSLGTYLISVQVKDISTGLTSKTASATVTLVSGNLSAAKVYPNPWRADKHAAHPSVTFAGLTVGTTIKIFTASARAVKELHTDGPTIAWDLANESGDKVASGVYLYVITDTQGDKVRGKIGIIK